MPPCPSNHRRPLGVRRPGGVDALDDLVAIGADLEPGTLLEAYRRGLFPMPSEPAGEPMYWWSPGAPRRPAARRAAGVAVAAPVGAARSRSASTPPSRPSSPRAPTRAAAAGWIDRRRSGRRTSGCTGSAGRTRSRPGADGELVGGLYGVAIGGLFAGESMFHRGATPRRSRWSACRPAARRARRRAAARRAVADPAPGLARGGRRSRGRRILRRLARALPVRPGLFGSCWVKRGQVGRKCEPDDHQ